MRDDPFPDEELLTSGPAVASRRRTLVVVAVLLLLAGLAVGVVMSSRGGDHQTKVVAPPPSGPVDPAPSTAGPVPGTSPDSAPSVLMNGFAYVVREGMLYAHAVAHGYINQAVVGPFRQPGGGYVLLGDAAHRRIWVVQSVASHWTAYEYDSATLEQIDAEGADGAVAGAAVLGGDLYVDTDVGVVRVVGPAASRLDRTAIRGGRAIAADPTRARLLLLDLDGTAAQLRAERPSGRAPLLAARTPVVSKGSLAVVAGHIWAAGFGERGAVLFQVDPRTLRPLAHSPVEAEMGPGALIVASGRQDFLVRSGDGRPELWCLDGRTGAVRQTWPDVAGAAMLDPDASPPRAYTLTSEFVPVPLRAGGCRG